MNAFYIILAACPVLLLGVVAFLVLIAVGVRKGDRRDLASPACSPTPRTLGVSVLLGCCCSQVPCVP